MPYDDMTYDVMMHDVMTYDIMIYDIMTYNVMIHDIMTYDVITYAIMTSRPKKICGSKILPSPLYGIFSSWIITKSKKSILTFGGTFWSKILAYSFYKIKIW